jgi:hypothetical protein
MSTVPTRPTNRYDWVGLFGGIVLSIILILLICGSQVESPKELTVGRIDEWLENTCLATDLRNGSHLLSTTDPSRPTLLWLGNSQLTAVNNRQPDQFPAPLLLHRELVQRGTDLVAIAPPNGNLQEHLVLFHAVVTRRKINTLLLPVCFDDLREDGVRPDIALAQKDDAVREALAASPAGQRIMNEAAPAEPMPDQPRPTSEVTEEFLNRWLASVLPQWAARGRARSLIAVRIYQMRNTLFGIKPQTVRPILASRYERNMAALEALLESADRKGIQVLVYLPPLRTDVSFPYDPAQYAKFKEELRRVTGRRGRFTDYDGLVPGAEWETKAGTTLGVQEELDFMHFAYPGHVRFKGQLLQDLTSFGWVPPAGGRP